MRPECEQFQPRLREICEGSAAIAKEKCNRYRVKWGLDALDDGEFPDIQRTRKVHPAAARPKQTQVVQRSKTKQTGCTSCGGKRKQQKAVGPGAELTTIMKAKGVPSCQHCKNLADQMDRWGTYKCRVNLRLIVDDIMPRAKAWVASNKPWAHALLPNVIEDAAIRAIVKGYVEQAISSACTKESKRGKTTAAHRRAPATAQPIVFTKQRPQTWAVGFTIADRKQPSWQRAVTSCRDAGWDPYLFAEPDVAIGDGERHIQRPATIAGQMFATLGPGGVFGAHQNYMQALADMLAAEPDAQMILYAQDDCYFPPGTRDVMESIRWPDDASLLSLWCPSGHGYIQSSPGLSTTPKPDIIGAIALAMPRATAEFLVSSPDMLNWSGSAGGQRGYKRRTLDMATGRALQKSGRVPYYFTRSIVDHFEPVDSNSSIGNGAVRGFRKSHLYVGDNASADVVREVFGGTEVHVIIPAHECLDLTLSCLDALHESTVEVHVCYVDNGSSPETIEKVAASLQRFSHLIIQNEQNEGFTRAVQQGLDMSDGRDVLILNNDCRVQPDTIEELLACKAANPKTAAVCPVTDDSGRCSVRLASNETLQRFGTSRVSSVLPWFCCLLDRHAVRQVSKLPTDAEVLHGLAVDDWWCNQVVAKGWTCRITGATSADHDHSATFEATGQDRGKLQKIAQKWLREQ